jgi:isoquinoline 1-oxidoreductase beta subunit
MKPIDRRTVLIGGGIGVGLIVALAAWPEDSASEGGGEGNFGPFIRIAKSGSVTIAVPQVETGQGAWTALPQIVADELGAAWETVGVEPAPLGGAFANPLAEHEGWLAGFGTWRALRLDRERALRITAGATSIRAFEQPLREVAAIAREMLIGAAADRWGIDPGQCESADGFVLSRGNSASFGELAEEASLRSAPSSPTLRTGTKARLAGQPLQRLDAPAKGNGSFRFAGDVRLPGMLFASARIAPPGGRVIGFDREAAARQPGVRHFAARDQWVAAAAETWWAAEKAANAANVRFTAPNGDGDPRGSFETAMAAGSDEWFSAGDYDAATADSRALAAIYFIAPSQHLALEPVSVTARVREGGLEIWAPTQSPEMLRRFIGQATGLPPGRISLFPMPVGEPAGAAIEPGPVAISVELARASGRPVQLMLSDRTSQNHRPSSPGVLARMTALPGAGGPIAAWQMHVVTGDGMGASLHRLAGDASAKNLGKTALEGAIPPYGIPHTRVLASRADLPFAIGYMRGSPQREMAFCTENFIDEMARAAGIEPLAFRMAMLGGNPRLARCLQSAARLARWDGGGRGSMLGIAGCTAFGSHIGLVALATIENGEVRAHRLVAAVDCGRVINPALVRQQVEGGLMWGLGQACRTTTAWVAGMPRARSFGALALPGVAATPDIMVHLVNSDDAPGGVNGLAETVVAPAIANALFAATGRRLRSLPFDLAAA